MQWFWKMILAKRWLRSDKIWTSSFLYSPLLRRIPLFFDTQALLRSQYWTREDIDALRDERLRLLIRKAERMPFWEGRLAATRVNSSSSAIYTSFLDVPILTKKDFLAQSPDRYLEEELLPYSSFDRTSGSTGRPFGFYHDRSYTLRSFGICERMFRNAADGERPHVITMRVRQRPGFVFTKFSFFHLRNYNSLPSRLSQLKELLSSLKARPIVFTWTSVAIELARILRESPTTKLPIRSFIVSGESLPDAQRKNIEGATGSRVFMLYGASDMGRLASECTHGRLHINEEWALLEVVDGNGNLVENGIEGRIVVTLYDNEVMPFVRYNSGDLGMINHDMCPCGRTLRTLQVRGREVQLLNFPDGRTVSLLDISVVFEKYYPAVTQFQILRTSSYGFTVRLVSGPNFKVREEALTGHLQKLLHPRAELQWDFVETIESGPSGKAVYFIDKQL